jgi:hypothetical protein
MSLKRTDLAKNLNLKIQGQMQHAAVPSSFSQASAVPDRREQRKLDQAAGLVPFAVKLNKELVARLGELASGRQVALNALVDEVLRAGLAQVADGASAAVKAPAPSKVAAKKAQPKKTEPKTTEPKKVAQKTADKPAAKKAAAKKAPAKTATKTAKKAAR